MKQDNSRRSFLSKAALAAAITPLAPLAGFGKGLKTPLTKHPWYRLRPI